jgi:hypothetical protein
MQLSIDALLVGQEKREGGTNYGESVDLTLVEVGTGHILKLNSPVAVKQEQMLIPVHWTVSDFKAELITWTKNGKGGSFLKQSCASLSGAVISGK